MRIIDQIIFRTPLFPISFITDAASLKCIYNSEEFSEATYLASPVFYKELNKYKAQHINSDKEKNKIQQSIYKYSSRASSRCTPFGLFAGVSTGKWGDSNVFTLNSELKKTLNRKTRLDMGVLCTLSYVLAQNPFIKPHLKFYPNSSLYQIGDYYRYIEYNFLGTKRFHKLSKVDYSDYLKNLFAKSFQGLCMSELINLLVAEGIDIDEATEVIDELIDIRLLVSELEPTVTGKNFFDNILSKLQSIFNQYSNKKLYELIQVLSEIKKLIHKLDINITHNIENYQLILEKLKKVSPYISEINMVQTDLFKHVEKAYLNKEIQKNILGAIKFLNKITPSYTNPKLENFKKKFQDRYQDAEIPLLQALDVESGLGYPSNGNEGINDLIDDIRFYRKTGATSSMSWSNLQAILLQILIDAFKENKYSVELTDDNFKEIDYTSKGLPHSLSIMFKVLNAETNTISMENFGGSSAINLLGRFANEDKTVLETLQKITDHEEGQTNGKILAEIVHLPENRTGNVVARPIIRNYEIPYLAKAGVDEEYQLAGNDLYISVRKNKIILRSKKLNKEIIPRLGNAHNFSSNGLPVYYFLCDLQMQYFSKPFLSFNWGAMSSQFLFLPRVEYKNVILSPAKWQFKKNDLTTLLNKKNNDEILNAFTAFKQKNNLPNLFVVAEGDNELLIDTKQDIAIYTFVNMLKKKQNIIIEEFLFNLEKPLVSDENGNGYTNECIAIVLNDENKLLDYQIHQTKEKKHFTIGSEWLYYKIYSGIETADNLLKEKISFITQTLLKEKIIDKWFFIRYADPETHLRLRLHIKDLERYQEVFNKINIKLEPLIENGVIFKIQIDQYERELERYGGNTIELSESLFHFDSIACVKALNIFSTEELRWQYALIATDRLLNDFKFNTQDKHSFMNYLSQNFFKEHGGRKELKLQLDNKYRKLKGKIKNVLEEISNNDEIIILGSLLKERSISNEKIVKEIFDVYDLKVSQLKINELLESHLHMMLNRIFTAKQRTNEFVVYDMMARYYKTNIAIEKKKVKIIPNSI